MTKTTKYLRAQAASSPVRRSDLLVEELDDEALVYDPVTADTHRLNKTAYFIWHACNGRSTTQKIAARLAQVYEVEQAKATRHANRLIDELVERRLLVTDPPTHG